MTLALRTTGLAALAVPLAALAVLAPAGTASAAADGSSLPAPQVPVLAGTSSAATLVEEELAADDARLAAPGAAFRVNYDGFPPAARAAFQRAVAAWASQLNSPVPITVRATFRPLGPGVLGSAGASLVHRDFAGAPNRGTFYVDAVANKRAGRQLDPSPDIVANFSSSFTNWHYGTGPAPRGKYDFQTVVMHELGHGLGLLGAGRIADGRGSVRIAGSPTAYDRHVENTAGRSLLSFADPSAALANQIRSRKLVFDSAAVRQANGGRPARLYAPSTYRAGSSYSHLDEATFRAGTRNSLMTPQIGDGETIRSSGPIVRAIFRSTGW